MGEDQLGSRDLKTVRTRWATEDSRWVIALTNDGYQGCCCDASGDGEVEGACDPQEPQDPALAVVNGIHSPRNDGWRE